MPTKTNQYFCGPHGIRLTHILGNKNVNNFTSWFQEDNLYYVFKARTAIRRSCELLEIESGCEVLTPSYNCGSEIDPLIKSGASIVLYRVDKKGIIDTADLYSRITSRTKAIYITHYFGFPQDLLEIKKICKQKGVYLVEDCALSLFSSSGGKKLGSVGDIAVFNFPKTLPVPDGGLLAINNSVLKEKFWSMVKPSYSLILKGMPPLLKSSLLRWSSKNNLLLYTFFMRTLNTKQKNLVKKTQINTWPDIPERYYYDERMSNLSISILTKRILQSIDCTFIKRRRRENYKLYLILLAGYPDIEPLYRELPKEVCPLVFPIILENKNSQEICTKLNDASITAIAWWSGYHRNLPWKDFPDACFLKDRLIALPIHQDLYEDDIKFLVKTLLRII